MFFVFLVLLSLGLTALCGSTLSKVSILIKKRMYDEAENKLKQAVVNLKGRSRYKALLMLASLERNIGDVEKDYRKVINNGNAKEALEAKLELAKIYYATGDYNKVLSILKSIRDKKNSDRYLEAIFFRAQCYRQLGMTAEARRDFEKIDRGQYLYPSYMALGELDMQDGLIDSAIKRFETIAGEYSNPIAGFRLGECYEIKGDREKAVFVYKTLLSQFPHSLEAPKAKEKISVLTLGKNRTPERPFIEESKESVERAPTTEEYHKIASDSTAIYTIQFGAFSERENAIKLTHELSKLNENVWIERVEVNGKTLYRVRMGRFPNRAKAEREAKGVNSKLGLLYKVLPLDK